MKKKKKKNPSTSEVLQEHAPQVIGDHSSKPPGGNKGDDFRLQQSPTTKQRHATVTPIRYNTCRRFLNLKYVHTCIFSCSVSESDSQAYGRRYTSPPPDNITHTKYITHSLSLSHTHTHTLSHHAVVHHLTEHKGTDREIDPPLMLPLLVEETLTTLSVN